MPTRFSPHCASLLTSLSICLGVCSQLVLDGEHRLQGSLPNSKFRDLRLAPWNQLWWENLHYSNGQTLQIREFLFLGEPIVKHLPACRPLLALLLSAFALGNPQVKGLWLLPLPPRSKRTHSEDVGAKAPNFQSVKLPKSLSRFSHCLSLCLESEYIERNTGLPQKSIPGQALFIVQSHNWNWKQNIWKRECVFGMWGCLQSHFCHPTPISHIFTDGKPVHLLFSLKYLQSQLVHTTQPPPSLQCLGEVHL